MSDLSLTKTRIRAGTWEGVLTGAAATPAVQVLLLDAELSGVTVAPVDAQPGTYVVRVPIPAAMLSDGVQTFIIRDKVSTAKLGHFTMITGVAMEDDIRAEVDLLRAELDMLKRAFRRHCLETAE